MTSAPLPDVRTDPGAEVARVDPAATVGDLVVAEPARARLFEELGIDYCCNGQRTLAQAAAEAGIGLDALVQRLTSARSPERSGPSASAPGSRESSALAHDIVDTHHAYLWAEMPRLAELVDKVHSVHGDRHPELGAVRAAYATLVAGLEPHLSAEERRVFPAISRLERTGTIDPVALRADLDTLRAEHAEVGGLLREMRSLTKGYAAPADACGSYRAMLAGLEEMERDLFEHIHKENNILFPRVEAVL